MPNSPSATKRLRSDARKRSFNQLVLSEIKTLKKKLKASIESKNIEESKVTAKTLITKLDKGVKKGTLPRTKVDRLKSRIQISINKLTPANS